MPKVHARAERDGRVARPMRTILLPLLLLLLLSGATAAADASLEAKKKAIRMKATSKLKEILKELKIKFDPKLGKDEIRELVLKEDALTRWEELHPEQKRAPRSQAGAGFGGGDDQMTAMFFTLLDDDKDGRLSKKEMEALGKLAPEGQKAGAPPPEQLFQLTDADRDGAPCPKRMRVATVGVNALRPSPRFRPLSRVRHEGGVLGLHAPDAVDDGRRRWRHAGDGRPRRHAWHDGRRNAGHDGRWNARDGRRRVEHGE